MKRGILCLLLLSGCSVPEYDYALTWTCLSPEGCERTEDVMLFDRLNVFGESFVFESTRLEYFWEDAQRLDSDSLPAGCFWLYAFSPAGKEVEPPVVCPTSEGFIWELAIPNYDPATVSLWRVEAAKL